MRLVAALVVAALAPSTAQAFTARGSVGEAYVLGAKRASADAVRYGRVVARGRADRFGSQVFRALKPGAGYTVRRRARRTRVRSRCSAGQQQPAALVLQAHEAEGGAELREGCATASSSR